MPLHAANLRCLPHWVTHYNKANLSQDLLAGIIVGILVIPQSLGYAMLSGLPPVYGLYSAIVPVLVVVVVVEVVTSAAIAADAIIAQVVIRSVFFM